MKHTISQLSLKRLCHRVGIKRISVDSYKPLYQFMISVLLDLADKIKTLSKLNKTKIINDQDVENAINVSSFVQSGGDARDYPGFCHGANSQCSNMHEPGQSIIPGAVVDSLVGGPPQMHSGGGGATRENDHFFTIPLTQFERFVIQHLPRNFSLQFSDDGMDRLQYHIENITMHYLANRNKLLQAQNVKQFFL